MSENEANRLAKKGQWGGDEGVDIEHTGDSDVDSRG